MLRANHTQTAVRARPSGHPRHPACVLHRREGVELPGVAHQEVPLGDILPRTSAQPVIMILKWPWRAGRG